MCMGCVCVRWRTGGGKYGWERRGRRDCHVGEGEAIHICRSTHVCHMRASRGRRCATKPTRKKMARNSRPRKSRFSTPSIPILGSVNSSGVQPRRVMCLNKNIRLGAITRTTIVAPFLASDHYCGTFSGVKSCGTLSGVTLPPQDPMRKGWRHAWQGGGGCLGPMTAERHVMLHGTQTEMLYGRDSWTQHWHDSLDPGWKLKFRCRLPCASSGSAMQSQPTASHRRRRQHTDYSYVDAEYPQARSPSPPKSPRRFRLLTNACPLCLLAKLA